MSGRDSLRQYTWKSRHRMNRFDKGIEKRCGLDGAGSEGAAGGFSCEGAMQRDKNRANWQN